MAGRERPLYTWDLFSKGEQKKKEKEAPRRGDRREDSPYWWRKVYRNRPLCLKRAPRATQKTRSLLSVTEGRVTRRHSQLRFDSSRRQPRFEMPRAAAVTRTMQHGCCP